MPFRLPRLVLVSAALVCLVSTSACDRKEGAAAQSAPPVSLPRATAAPAREGPVPLAHGTTDKAAGVSDTCVRMCAIMQSLHCPNDPPDCVQHCEEMRSLPICTSQMGAFIACVAARSAAECHCNEEGESEVRGTTCDAEQEAVATCIEQAS